MKKISITLAFMTIISGAQRVVSDDKPGAGYCANLYEGTICGVRATCQQVDGVNKCVSAVGCAYKKEGAKCVSPGLSGTCKKVNGVNLCVVD